MSIFSMSTNQMLLAVAVIGGAWVIYTMMWGAGTKERKEDDVSFGLFDDIFDLFK